MSRRADLWEVLRLWLEGEQALGLDLLPGPAGASPLLALARRAAGCTACPLHRGRTRVVFGEGPARARLLFVGEGPGREEDRTGRPFVGPAGELLTRMIQAMGLRREEVYITNIVKCRPPGNRAPAPEEVLACRPFLEGQIRALGPEVICALGAPAAQTLLGTGEGIRRLRGRPAPWPPDPRITVLPTYHPAYLLRRPEAKREAWADLQAVMRLLGLPLPRDARPGRPA